MKRHTPWGQADQETAYGPDGIVFVSTPSHGGFYVPREVVATMPAALYAINPFAGEGWYEEDCDAAIVPLAFPHLFKPRDVAEAAKSARLTVGMWRFAPVVVAWLDSDDEGANEVREIIDSYDADRSESRLRLMEGGL